MRASYSPGKELFKKQKAAMIWAQSQAFLKRMVLDQE